MIAAKPKKLPPIVYVEWVDAVAVADWSKDAEPPHRCYASGFVVADTADHLTVAAVWSAGQHNAAMSIPKAWIKKRRRVAVVAAGRARLRPLPYRRVRDRATTRS